MTYKIYNNGKKIEVEYHRERYTDGYKSYPMHLIDLKDKQIKSKCLETLIKIVKRKI